MARATKCPYCGVSFDRDKEEFVQIKNRYAHKSCHDEAQANVSKEQKDLKELEEYIMKMFKEDYINARIKLQIKRMREQYNYSYSGIHKSLIYFFEVKGNSIEKANGGIGIVPYIYNDAYKYYFALHTAQQKNENKQVTEYVKKGEQIKIKPPERKPRMVRMFKLEEDNE